MFTSSNEIKELRCVGCSADDDYDNLDQILFAFKMLFLCKNMKILQMMKFSMESQYLDFDMTPQLLLKGNMFNRSGASFKSINTKGGSGEPII